jgi:hypothetical protein
VIGIHSLPSSAGSLGSSSALQRNSDHSSSFVCTYFHTACFFIRCHSRHPPRSACPVSAHQLCANTGTYEQNLNKIGARTWLCSWTHLSTLQGLVYITCKLLALYAIGREHGRQTQKSMAAATEALSRTQKMLLRIKAFCPIRFSSPLALFQLEVSLS